MSTIPSSERLCGILIPHNLFMVVTLPTRLTSTNSRLSNSNYPEIWNIQLLYLLRLYDRNLISLGYSGTLIFPHFAYSYNTLYVNSMRKTYTRQIYVTGHLFNYHRPIVGHVGIESTCANYPFYNVEN